MVRKVGKIIGILLGNALFTLGIAGFIIPNQFLVGGSTGIARSVQHYMMIDVSITIAVINIITFALGLYFLGKNFALTTLISTMVYPFFLNRLLQIEALQSLTTDRLLAAIVGGLLIGGGIGLVIRLGGSSGGMDIPPLILSRKFRIPVALLIYIFDVGILLLQITYSNTEQILYGIISVLITTTVLNQVLVYGAGDVQVFIISKEYERINDIIQTQLDRGSTFVQIQTGHKKVEQKAILCVLPNRDIHRLNRSVLEIDPHAFMIINGAREVKGKGFTLDKYLE